jgi:hypothetical protein
MISEASPAVAYYAMGGGHGHVLRGLAVLERLGYGTLIGPPRLAGWARAAGVEYLSPPSDGADRWLSALPRPDLLLVDVFPRGAVAELLPLLERVPAWLVARAVRPAFYRHVPVAAAIESRYERIVWTEPPPEGLEALGVPSAGCEPVLFFREPLEREAARAALGVGAAERLILALGSGEASRQERLCGLLGRIAARLPAELRFISDELAAGGPVVHLFPAARYLAAADVVVTAGGYHAFHETRAAGVPTVYVPQRRQYDDQHHRVRGCPVASDPAGLERAVRALIVAERRARRTADAGAKRLAGLVRPRVEPGAVRSQRSCASTKMVLTNDPPRST